jgi:CheY-like chemotaxis protein
VAHDFNNMLGVIRGYAELAIEQVEEGSALRENLAEIQTAAERSAELTQQLMAFARKQTVAPKVLDLNETTAGMLKLLRRLIGEDIELIWTPGEGVWPVKIDPSQLDQILTNLAINARDAIGGVGRLTIQTAAESLDAAACARHEGAVPGDYVMLSVGDTGCGMDLAAQAHLFEPFYTTKGLGKGTGLGLATVYGSVRQNDGFIAVSSAPGSGTTFRIYLPRARRGSALAASAGAPSRLEGAGQTVLLVEDEPALLALSQSMLERLGFEVLAAGRPGDALRLAAEHPKEIRLLITDVVMPEMNGRELAGRVQSLRPGLKTLYMSGYTADVIAHHGMLEEGVHFINKPVSRHDLAAKVLEALAS